MILAVMAVFVGAVSQRIAGMGFAMMVAPFVVLAIGPLQGVVLVNLCGAATAAVTLLLLHRDVQWHTFGWLISSSVVGIVAGSMVVRSLDVPVVQTLIGAVLVIAVLGSVLVARTTVSLSGRRWTLMAGAATGALVAAAGVGGPPMTIHAVLSRWDQRSFAATMQPYQAAVSALAVAAALVMSPSAWPDLSGEVWLIIVGAIAAGLALGNRLSTIVSPHVGRVVVITLALLGALITLTTGVADLTT